MYKFLYKFPCFYTCYFYILLVLMSDLWFLNRCLKFNAEATYRCLELLHSTKYITFQELQVNSPLASYCYQLLYKQMCFRKSYNSFKYRNYSPREKGPNTEFFLVRIFPHSGWIRTNINSVFGHFSRSDCS